ncbi:MAG TPA: tyrosine--tRNA ligase [Candidatus Acidoferrum sp.]
MTTETKFKPVDEQLPYLKKGVSEIVPEPELRAKLEKSLKTGRPLRVKLGVDPTAPDIHLGHTVVIRKLKHFQEMGHTAIFLIGDFTAMVGDPTGQSETRPPLTREQVNANAQTYLEQVFRILDRDKTEVRYNSEWLDKLSSYDIVRLCAKYRVARMMEREDFRKRLTEQQPISVHEFLYPLLVAYDSVVLKADVELGATEQKFNLLIGREIQREYNEELQVAVMMPILVGLDGQRKMSKSLGNYVGITEPPQEMFGKMMSIPDELMWSYYELVTDRTPQEIAALKQEVASDALHPMDAKMRLAEEVVSGFQGAEAARKAAENFQRVFRDRQAPEEMREVVMKRLPMGISVQLKSETTQSSHMATGLSLGPEKWSKLLAYLGETASASEAERLIKQGGFEVNGSSVKDPTCRLDLSQAGSYDVRAGKKKFLRIVIE